MSDFQSPEIQTNFLDRNGVDLGKKYITNDYFISVYPSIADKIGIPPELWVWGSALNGERATNDNLDKLTPVTTFAGGTNWKQVSSGDNHTAAVTSGIPADLPLS